MLKPDHVFIMIKQLKNALKLIIVEVYLPCRKSLYSFWPHTNNKQASHTGFSTNYPTWLWLAFIDNQTHQTHPKSAHSDGTKKERLIKKNRGKCDNGGQVWPGSLLSLLSVHRLPGVLETRQHLLLIIILVSLAAVLIIYLEIWHILSNAYNLFTKWPNQSQFTNIEENKNEIDNLSINSINSWNNKFIPCNCCLFLHVFTYFHRQYDLLWSSTYR